MSPASTRSLGNVLLVVATFVLLAALSGMSGLTPKLAPSRELVITAAVLVILARVLRRRGRETGP